MNAEHPPAQPEAVSIITMSRLRVLSCIALGMSFLALALVCISVMEMPKLVSIFEDFDTALPRLTLLVMQISPIGYYLLCAITAILLLGKEFGLRDRGISLVINVGITGVALLLWATIERAMQLPLHQLIFNVSK